MLSKSLENSLSYSIFYKFWEKTRVYYTLSIFRGGGQAPPPPPVFATVQYQLLSLKLTRLTSSLPYNQQKEGTGSLQIAIR